MAQTDLKSGDGRFDYADQRVVDVIGMRFGMTGQMCGRYIKGLKNAQLNNQLLCTISNNHYMIKSFVVEALY